VIEEDLAQISNFMFPVKTESMHVKEAILVVGLPAA
jgi:hypothetical protein